MTTFIPGHIQSTVSGNSSGLLSRVYVGSAALADGGYVLTWQQQPNGAQTDDRADIWSQRFNAEGREIGNAVRVNTTTIENQSTPQAAGLTGGNYVIVWESEGQDGSGAGIYMQRYAANGNPIGGEVLVNSRTAGDQSGASVEALANGGYVVTWSEQVENTGGDWSIAIKMQRYAANGATQGGELTVFSETSPDAFGLPDAHFHNIDVAQLTGGNLAVSWTRSSFDDGSKAQMSVRTSTGAAVAGPIEPEQTTDDFGTEPQQRIVQLGNGNVLIVYGYGYDATGQANVGYGEIYGRIYNSSGVAVGNEFAIVTGTENRRFDLFASSDGKGGALIGWVEEAATVNERNLLVQQVTQSGAPVGDPMVSFVFEGFQMNNADMIVLNDGRAVVSAQNSGLGASGNILHRQLMDGEDVRFSNGADVVALGNGGESVAALGGADDVTGGTGDDFISGGSASDILKGARGQDVIHGGGTADNIDGGAHNDLMFGDAGNDVIRGKGGHDTAAGGTGDDDIRGDAGDDVLYGFEGADTIFGGAGDDEVYGYGTGFENTPYGNSEDFDLGIVNILNGGGGDDLIAGARGNDVIDGGQGTDIMRGGGDFFDVTGDDLFIGSNGRDISNGGDGTDTIDYSQIGRALVLVSSDLGGGTVRRDVTLAASGSNFIEDQVIYDIEIVIGSQLSDTMTGIIGVDQFHGEDGDDTLSGLEGGDILAGGDGIDTISGGDGEDILAGGNDGDIMHGDNNNDVVNGQGGDDELFGDGGNDVLIGGAGLDHFSGGEGADTMNSAFDGVRDIFVYADGDEKDRVNSFEQGGVDELHLDDALWSATHGSLTGQQVVNTFGTINGAGTLVTLNFGSSDILTISSSAGLALATLGADIQIL